MAERRAPTLPSYTGVLVAFVCVVVALVLTEPYFATADNIRNILRTSAVPTVLAVGVTFTLLGRGIDLSVGSLLALTGVVLLGLSEVMPESLAVVGAVVFASVTGAAANGALIGFLRLPPLVTTLGTLAVFRGFAFILADGETRYVEAGGLVTRIGDGNLGPVPVPVLLALVVTGVAAVVLRVTYFGRDVYAVGGNPDAALLAGIPVARVTTCVYLVSGLAAGVAAVMQAGRLGSVSPGIATGIELHVVAGVLLGGTSLAGGRGSVTGTLVAILFLGTVQNGLTLLDVSSFWQLVVTGSILVLAVLFDRARDELAARRTARRAAQLA